MEFNSVAFLIFLAIVLCLYYVMPGKFRPLLLFISGFFFYMSWNAKYGVLLAIVMLISFWCAICVEKSKNKKIYLIGCILIDVLILFLFKYTGMMLQTINDIRLVLKQSQFSLSLNIILPIGISFYIFQSMGYIIDVYRGKTKAETNIINFGAFVAFFPQLVAGPIERSSNLLQQINSSKDVKPHQENLSKGIMQMLFGYFEKVVIADRIAGVVTIVYSDYDSFGGVYIVLATVLFAFQIYCDFDGYTNIAIGVARLFGIKLIKNFNTPYLATSITDFWRRWHISLSSWLKDYVYISLGGNRCSKIKKYRNILVTFLVSGIWHGANWTYVVWGIIHGLIQIIEDVLGLTKCTNKFLQMVKIGITFLIADFAWLFFRADSLMDSVGIIKQICFNFDFLSLISKENFIRLELTMDNFCVLIISLITLFLVDVYKYKLDKRYNGEKEIYDMLYSLPVYSRVTIGYIVFLIIVIFGHYGPQYNAAQFIYFQF